MTDFKEIELTEMDDMQLEHLGRSLIPPFEVDRRNSVSKIIDALLKHVKDTEAVVSDEWTGEVPSEDQTGADGPSEPDLPASEDPDPPKPTESKSPAEGAEAEKRETALADRESALREREEAVSKREDAAVAHTSDGGAPGPVGRTEDFAEDDPEEFDPMAELRELEQMTIVPTPQQLYMQPSERKFRERLHAKIQTMVKRVARN